MPLSSTYIELIALAVLKLLCQCSLNSGLKLGKFTIGYNLLLNQGDDANENEDSPRGSGGITIGSSILLEMRDECLPPNAQTYYEIKKLVAEKAENDKYAKLMGIFIRIYYSQLEGTNEPAPPYSTRRAGFVKDGISPIPSRTLSEKVWDIFRAGVKKSGLPSHSGTSEILRELKALKKEGLMGEVGGRPAPSGTSGGTHPVVVLGGAHSFAEASQNSRNYISIAKPDKMTNPFVVADIEHRSSRWGPRPVRCRVHVR